MKTPTLILKKNTVTFTPSRPRKTLASWRKYVITWNKWPVTHDARDHDEIIYGA